VPWAVLFFLNGNSLTLSFTKVAIPKACWRGTQKNEKIKEKKREVNFEFRILVLA